MKGQYATMFPVVVVFCVCGGETASVQSYVGTRVDYPWTHSVQSGTETPESTLGCFHVCLHQKIIKFPLFPHFYLHLSV